MDTGMGKGWLMASLVNGGITRNESENPVAKDATPEAGTLRGKLWRLRATRATTPSEVPPARPAAKSDPAAPLDEVIVVDLTEVVAEKVSHGRAR